MISIEQIEVNVPLNRVRTYLIYLQAKTRKYIILAGKDDTEAHRQLRKRIVYQLLRRSGL
jgi:hypothetical protein